MKYYLIVIKQNYFDKIIIMNIMFARILFKNYKMLVRILFKNHKMFVKKS